MPIRVRPSQPLFARRLNSSVSSAARCLLKVSKRQPSTTHCRTAASNLRKGGFTASRRPLRHCQAADDPTAGSQNDFERTGAHRSALNTAARAQRSVDATALSFNADFILTVGSRSNSVAFCRYARFSSDVSTGNARMRWPVALKIALQMAAEVGGTPGSPTPPGGASLGTIYTRVSGTESIRATW
ncbi:hypothetical protein OKW40_005171 [Paraburkholderia sp. RAU6.4a]